MPLEQVSRLGQSFLSCDVRAGMLMRMHPVILQGQTTFRLLIKFLAPTVRTNLETIWRVALNVFSV